MGRAVRAHPWGSLPWKTPSFKLQGGKLGSAAARSQEIVNAMVIQDAAKLGGGLPQHAVCWKAD